ncbi:MAG TPA: hypothetical protein PLV06_10815 [Bacteroidales bacterium]|nr:hypothetical protein [Bacteroidales bacterium]HPF03155.1 hypothetical protein [Bacteroidales bacterium]HPJ59483.1 hypothetical protein [Bacteroidales bacterium]HPR12866.1 hypothetical protein [Bacteroidales bacterium]HRW85107.1 hypothetical protein [Bacteroidales bacterium]
MNKVILFIVTAALVSGCANHNNNNRFVAVAKVGDEVLYLHQVPSLSTMAATREDSLIIVRDYVNKWAREEMVFQKAQENLSAQLRDDINRQLREMRSNLTVYQYQRQMIMERMDTVVKDSEMEEYYNVNNNSFILGYNIVKALLIKLPFETPNLWRIRSLARSNEQKALQQLDSLCYQFAEIFNDFNEMWVPLDRISVELPQEISNEEYFLRRTSYYEYTDSIDIYLLKIRDYRLRSTPAPFDYVRDDIRRIILNNRRLEFIKNLETGIYNDGIHENKLTIYNNW